MRRKRNRKKKPGPDIREIGLDELQAILDRAKSGPLDDDEYGKLKAAVDTLAFLTSELEKKGVSIKRLRKLIFGASTEKTSQVFKDAQQRDGPGADSGSADGEGEGEKNKAKKRKGHGRNGASDYAGAERIRIAHESLHSGDLCPGCEKGKVYPQKEPAVMVRVRGMAPLGATVYERERFRCNLCGEVFTAASPEGVGEEKYDETAAAMIALLKYGAGLPFNRIEKLQKGLGIPMPASVQWEVVDRAAEPVEPAYAEMVRQAAQGKVLHNDDTTMKILELDRQSRQDGPADGDDAGERTGVFTSGIVSVDEGHKTALFFTGRRHAGENLETVLAQRAKELSAPIQMSDALSRNTSGDFQTIMANCLAHGRRRFVDVADNFPDEVRHVLEELKKVYKIDDDAREQGLSPAERLSLHKAQSGPLMKALKKWLKKQLAERKVEPNSGLGEAITYMVKHWEKMTLFLRVAGAPVDNNICERALKKAILHRKNAYFYKTENGARVGDMFMSMIHTAELCRANPFDYLVALQRHADEVEKNPGEWMPWNFTEALQRLNSGVDPPR